MKQILGILLVIVVLGGGIFWLMKGRKGSVAPTGPTSAPETILPLEKRPYVILVPRNDGHEIKLEVTNINEAETIDYELLYMAGDASRGVIGSVELKGEKNFTRDLTLGSCSKNVCKYDEGVTGGTLNLKLKGDKTQKYELPFKLSVGKEAKAGLVSADGNFTFQGNLEMTIFYLVGRTIGLPQVPTGRVIGGPYSIFSAGSTVAKGTIKLKLDQSSPTVKVLGWDRASQAWKEYQKGLETDGNIVSVEVDSLTTFVAVNP